MGTIVGRHHSDGRSTRRQLLRIDAARDAALSNYEIWAAIKGHGAGVQFVDTSTGEIDKGSKPEPYLRLHQYLTEYQGIPERLSPLKRGK